ncbi:autotransporter domain-containing protein [Microvirga brassicacearum]|nr:autotransporter domain-containing protein [Microvirga brassicacearum]
MNRSAPRLRLVLLASTAMAAGVFVGRPALAIDYYYTGASGLAWSNPAGWNSGAVPQSGIDTEIMFVSPSGNFTTINDRGALVLRLIEMIGDPSTTTFGQTGNGSLVFDGVNPVFNAWAGPVIVNQAVQLNQPLSMQGTIIFNQPISGSGGLRNSGNITLNAVNTYSGTTFIFSPVTISSDANLGQFDAPVEMWGGTLIFSGPMTLGPPRPLRLVTYLGKSNVFQSDSAVTIASAMGGNAGFHKEGAGTLTLTGANTYTGTTAIQAGTLRIGDGGTIGSVIGNIANNSDLVFDRADDPTYGGVISGAGTITKTGAGTLTLTGDSPQTGLVTVAAGALQIGNGGTSGSLAGNIANSASLAFDRSDDFTYSGRISGAGVVAKSGAGMLTLTGDSTHTGTTTVSAGTLRIGAGGTTGWVPGDISLAGGASLIFNRSDDVVYGGDILGRGTVVKDGPGTVVLETNRMTHTLAGLALKDGVLEFDPLYIMADLSFDGGTLRFKNSSMWTGLASSYAIPVSSRGGTVEIDISQFGARWNISGPGDLRIKAGTNKFFLGGSDTRTGATFLDSGTLATTNANSLSAASAYTLGDLATLDLDSYNQTVGSLAGAGRVTLGSATLTTGGNDASTTFSGVMSGTGGLVKNGSGTFTLTGANTYTGGTTISAGALQIGDGGASGSVLGPIVNDAALILNHSDDVVFANAISGTGTLTKKGGGRAELTGASAMSGATHVKAGELAVNGSLARSAVTIHNGATLSGTGTVGGIDAAAGAIVAPGNSIGTLNVAGNVAFGANATYKLEIDGAGNSDRIAAVGNATLSGSTVAILPDRGAYSLNPYTILTAQSVTGTFSGTGGDFAFVIPTLGYTKDVVTLTLVRKSGPPEPPTPPAPLAFHTAATTANQYATADALEALGEGNRLFDTLIGASTGGARQAFDALSGEAHASVIATSYGDAALVQSTLLGRMRKELTGQTIHAAYAADRPETTLPVAIMLPSSERFALWGEGFGSFGRTRSNGNAAALDTSTGGFVIGAETHLAPGTMLGIAGGFSRTTFDVDARLSSSAVESTFGAVYGSTTWGNIRLRLGGAYAFNDLDTTRSVALPGFADRLTADYDGSTLQAFGELGYRIDWGGIEIEPFLGGAVLRVHRGGFAENGGAAALTGFAQAQNLTTATLGMRAQVEVGDALRLRGLVGWRHAFGDIDPISRAAFAGSASAFLVSGAPIDQDALIAEAGLEWQASKAITVGASYQGQIGSHAQEHALKGDLTWRF